MTLAVVGQNFTIWRSRADSHAEHSGLGHPRRNTRQRATHQAFGVRCIALQVGRRGRFIDDIFGELERATTTRVAAVLGPSLSTSMV